MANQELRVLHVEDDFADAMLVQNAICESGDYGIAIEVVGTLKAAKRKLAKETYDLILLDLRLPDSIHPADTLETTQSCCGDIPLLVLSGSISTDDAYLPDDIARLDKNKGLMAHRDNKSVDLASYIRETAATGIQMI